VFDGNRLPLVESKQQNEINGQLSLFNRLNIKQFGMRKSINKLKDNWAI
jgi:hypothetical protein